MPHDRHDRAGQRLLDRRNPLARRRRRALVEGIGGLFLPPVISRAAVGDGELVTLADWHPAKDWNAKTPRRQAEEGGRDGSLSLRERVRVRGYSRVKTLSLLRPPH